MLILIIALQFQGLDYQGLTPGVEALAMSGVPATVSFSNPSSINYNPAALSILPGSILRYERYITKKCGPDTERFPDNSFIFASPQLSFLYHPVVSYDETTTVESGSVFEREHRRTNITEYIISITSHTGNELTFKEHIYFGLNIKLYSGNFFSVKAKRIGNAWQEPEEIISSTLSPGLDLGLILWYNKLTLGGMAEDVYTRMAWQGQDAFTLPRIYRIACGLRPINAILVSTGLEYKDKWLPAAGTELFFGKSSRGIVLRGGIGYDPDTKEYSYSTGLGIHSPKFRLDGGIRYLDPGMVIAIAVSITE